MRQRAREAAREAPPAEPAKGVPDNALREGQMEGVLLAVGKLGYRAASVRAILEHSGGSRAQFYRDFAGKEDCFDQAYALWIERHAVSLLECAARADGWRAGLREALACLFQFVGDQPLIARSLFVEVQVAGGDALAKHDEVMERMATVVDSVRSEIDPAEAPPEAAGAFVVAGVEACISDALSGGDPGRVWNSLPELVHFAVGSYLGREAAEEEFEAAKEFLAQTRAETGAESP